MRDEFAASRLPDLPNAGYQTHTERALTDAIMGFLRAMERDRIVLLKIVIDGPAKWRKVAAGKWRGSKMPTDLLDAMFGYLALLAGKNPQAQYEQLVALNAMPHYQRATWMERLTPAEIETRVRDSLSFTEAIRTGSKSVRDLTRRG